MTIAKRLVIAEVEDSDLMTLILSSKILFNLMNGLHPLIKNLSTRIDVDHGVRASDLTDEEKDAIWGMLSHTIEEAMRTDLHNLEEIVERIDLRNMVLPKTTH